ncbi:MAG TPA: class I SAM-dependent methyltransferase [Allosphingosinicella sp.]
MAIAPAATEIEGPFGPAHLVLTFPVARLAAMYKARFDLDVSPLFAGIDVLRLYRCEATGTEFWRPTELAGDEQFYRRLSAVARRYYQEWRWEYDLVHPHLGEDSRLLEIGCGRGYFLRSTEGKVGFAKGIEFNREAIANKVTRWAVEATTIEQAAAAEGASFDLVCSFQVLEHVVDPASFIRGAVAALKPGGTLALSVPNQAHRPFRRRSDPLDLPPHHMNHFTHETLVRTAGVFGLEPISVHTQVRRHDYAPLPRAIVGNAAKWVANRAYAVTGEPGHTMIGFFRKN